MHRRFLALGLAFLCAVASVARSAEPDRRGNLEDFDAMWRAVDEGYAYFEGSRARWKRARAAWRPQASAAKTRSQFLLALEGALETLHDDHVTLSERTASSARLIPGETDAWAEWRDGKAVVTAVRPFSEADIAGLHPGHVVTHVNAVPVERAARDRLRASGATDPASLDWALRQLLAIPLAGKLRLAVSTPRGSHALEIEPRAVPASNGPPIIARRMGDERDIGYIRIRNVLAHPRIAKHLDEALDHLKDTRALILDLRETHGGGARTVTEAILARFADAGSPWQAREVPGRGRIVDRIAPAPEASTFRGRLVVLVDRWTAGEGEALAAGLEGAAHATLVGTAMAGQRGELREVKLPHSGIAVRFPAEKVFHVNGTPRAHVRPGVEVDLASPSGGPGDPILYQALKLLEERSSPARGDRNAPR